MTLRFVRGNFRPAPPRAAGPRLHPYASKQLQRRLEVLAACQLSASRTQRSYGCSLVHARPDRAAGLTRQRF